MFCPLYFCIFSFLFFFSEYRQHVLSEILSSVLFIIDFLQFLLFLFSTYFLIFLFFPFHSISLKCVGRNNFPLISCIFPRSKTFFFRETKQFRIVSYVVLSFWLFFVFFFLFFPFFSFFHFLAPTNIVCTKRGTRLFSRLCIFTVEYASMNMSFSLV